MNKRYKYIVIFGFADIFLSNNVLATEGLIKEVVNDSMQFAHYTDDNLVTGIELSQHLKPRVDFNVMATAYSPILPIHSFLGDWDTSLKSGDFAYIEGRAALSVHPTANSLLSYGLGWRYDYLLTFSEPTADVYWLYKNEVAPPTATNYPLFLKATYNERIGANVGFEHNILPNIRVTTQANAWQGLHALDGKIAGNVKTRNSPLTPNEKLSDSIDTSQLSIDYYYDEPALGEEDLGWDYGSPNGYGYSFDVGVEADITEKTLFIIKGYDVLGRMYWQEMPSTQYALSYDRNGRPLYTLEGQLLKEDVTQTLPWRVESSLQHRLTDDWQLGLHGQVNDVTSLYQLSASHIFDTSLLAVTVTGLLEPQTQAFGFAVDTQYAGIKLLADDFNAGNTKRSEVSLYGRYAW